MKQETINAIKWIDGLLTDTFKKGKDKLGNHITGYCCLGAGCKILNLNYDYHAAVDGEFIRSVGLLNTNCSFAGDKPIKGYYSLIGLNDRTALSLKQIGEIIKENINDIFLPEVAAELTEHYKPVTNA